MSLPGLPQTPSHTKFKTLAAKLGRPRPGRLELARRSCCVQLKDPLAAANQSQKRCLMMNIQSNRKIFPQGSIHIVVQSAERAKMKVDQWEKNQKSIPCIPWAIMLLGKTKFEF